jgi:hypothetical protein
VDRYRVLVLRLFVRRKHLYLCVTEGRVTVERNLSEASRKAARKKL